MPQHGARLQHQPSVLAEKRIKVEVRANRRSIHRLRAVPILFAGIAVFVPPLAADRRLIGIQGALEPQKQRLEIASARARNRNGIGRDFGWPPGRVSVRKDWLVHLSKASGVLEVLEQRAPSDPQRRAIGQPDPNGTPAHPDLNLLPGKILYVAEPALVKIASSLPNQDLIAEPETEGAGRIGQRRATTVARNVLCRLHERCWRKALCRPG